MTDATVGVRKNRRSLMAELVLLADPSSIHSRGDEVSLSVEFDTVNALQSWLQVAGLNTPDLLTGEHEGTRNDRPYRSLAAYPTWHGWEIYATATEYADRGHRIEPDTADRLTALAAAP
jgi:hypothetical protein